MTKLSFSFAIEQPSKQYPYVEYVASMRVSDEKVPEGVDPFVYLQQRLTEEILRAIGKMPAAGPKKEEIV